MVRFILENLDKPLKNAEITAVTGLHENYAIALFSRIMRIPPRQFLVRMRLMRARALLVESSMAIPSVAEASGFSSISQFYHRFREAYGVSPARCATATCAWSSEPTRFGVKTARKSPGGAGARQVYGKGFVF